MNYDAALKAAQEEADKWVGDPKVKCPKLKTGLLVLVYKDDDKEAVGGADVDIARSVALVFKKTKSATTSGNYGLARFKPVDPANYQVKAVKLPQTLKAYELPEAKGQAVALGTCPVCDLQIKRLATLKVKVVFKQKDAKGQETVTVLDGVKVHIDGREKRDGTTTKAPDGWALFENLKSSDYTVSVTSMESHAKKYRVPPSTKVPLPPGATKEVVLEVKMLARLRVVLIDKEDKPLSGVPWDLSRLVIGNGKTKGDGLIEVKDMLPRAESYVLKTTLKIKQPKAPSGKASTVKSSSGDATKYPPPLKPTDFEIKDDERAAIESAEVSVEWKLQAKFLEDLDNERGDQCRLRNLGFVCEPDADAGHTAPAVRCYQRQYLKQDNGSGKLSDIQADLRKRHDQP
ncbi:MAG: hypothetical protein HZA90_09045 [Verrucomicrobia bacterium]|nr:hypothetical protein [Verrucomicrobiota bacterium]